MYQINFAETVADDLTPIRAFDRKRILDRIDEQLPGEPGRQTRNKKPIHGLIPPWVYEPPLWELRIGEYRVFYDINEAQREVTVRAIRHKPSNKTTEEIL